MRGLSGESDRMGHDHAHDHHGHRGKNRRRITLALVLTSLYLVAEVIGGFVTNSLALLADAGHMFSDVAALALALFALWIAERPANAQRTYGYYRVEILAALVNGAALIAVSAFIVYEAIQRLQAPEPIDAPLMIAIAAGGLVMNLIGLKILSGGKRHSLNMRGAYLHMLGDALGSIGAIAGGVAVWAGGWYWADAVASLVIAGLVIYSAVQLLRETVAVLMESAPSHIDVDEVRDALVGVTGVMDVHDIHVWTITSGLESFSGHVVTSGVVPHDSLLDTLRRLLHDRFGIDHVTLQIEPPDFDERGRC
jgi:cobalt-zinc-cadmium efflux system protein